MESAPLNGSPLCRFPLRLLLPDARNIVLWVQDGGATVAWSFQELLAGVLEASRWSSTRPAEELQSRRVGVRVSGGFLSGYQAGKHKTTRWLLASCATVSSYSGSSYSLTSVAAPVLLCLCQRGTNCIRPSSTESWTHCSAFFPFLTLSSFHSLCFFFFTCVRRCMCVFFLRISHQLHPKLCLCDAIRFTSRPSFCLLGTKCLRPEIALLSLSQLSPPLYLSLILSHSSHTSFEDLKCMLSCWAEVEIPAGRATGALFAGPRLKAKG